MKKIYNSPVVRYINLETEGVIAGSDKVGFGGEGEDLDAANAYTEKKENIWEREGIWK